MVSQFNSSGLFLVKTLFDLYIFVLMLRLILAFVRADFHHPLTQFVVKLTQFIIAPLRKILPNIGNIETSSLVLIFVLETIKFMLIGILFIGTPNIVGAFVLGLGDALNQLINIFFYAILISVILSWVQGPYSPASVLINQITLPIMQPLRRIIPPIGGMDITPIPAMILLQLLGILLVAPIMQFGTHLAFGV